MQAARRPRESQGVFIERVIDARGFTCHCQLPFCCPAFSFPRAHWPRPRFSSRPIRNRATASVSWLPRMTISLRSARPARSEERRVGKGGGARGWVEDGGEEGVCGGGRCGR